MRAKGNSARVHVALIAIFAALLLGGLIGPLMVGRSAHAQVPPVPSPTVPSVPDPAADDVRKAKEFGDLLDALDDIDRLHALNPLKITPDQIDKIIAVETAAALSYNKKSALLGVPEIMTMADEIRATKKAALAGEAIPKDFDDRVIKIQADITAKRDRMSKENLRSLSTTLQTILSPAQVATAAKLSKDAATRLGQESEGTDKQWFNSYVLDTFINNPRIVVLLKSIRAAATSNAGTK